MKFNRHKSVLVFSLAGIALLVVYGLLDPSVWPFPKCPFLMLTGWQCPGCGSQRAIHLALHGSFYQSFQFNPLLLPAVAYALFAYGTAFFRPLHWPAIRARYYGTTAAWVVLSIIMVFWMGRNLI